MNLPDAIKITILIVLVMILLLISLLWWGFDSKAMSIITEDELQAMKRGAKFGKKAMKPKKIKKKIVEEEEMDEEDMALKIIEDVRKQKQQVFIKKQFRPTVLPQINLRAQNINSKSPTHQKACCMSQSQLNEIKERIATLEKENMK